MLAGHHIVGSTVCFASDDGDLRDRGLRVGEKQLGSIFNDTAVLLVTSRKESRNVNKGHDRDIEGIAESHEASGFLGRLDVENTSLECNRGR